MLDGLFQLVSGTLNFFYTLIPNYAVAIALLTCVVMLITTPLTLKGTRSMIEMQRLQPQIRRLQVQYKDDRAKLNEELMAFYREHEINPVGGCLPLLYQSLIGKTEMNAIGKDHFDLSISAIQALSKGFLVALPYILLVAMIAFLSWYQQRQIMGRNANAEVNPQQQMMMRIGPALYVFFAFVSPAAIGIYFLVSTAWRVGQQAFITRSLYSGEDSIGRQAQKAMQEARDAKKNGGGTAAKKPVDSKPVDRKPVDRKPVDKGSRTTARNGSGNG